MDEKQKFLDELKDIYAKRRAQRKQDVDNALPTAKEIIDLNFRLDNTLEGAQLIVEGVRRNIYKKDGIYFLGDVNGNIDELYHPTKDYSKIEEEFQRANEDLE